MDKEIVNELLGKFLKTGYISTDTRDIKSGSIFFALKGQRFDGNDFTKEALSKGAVLAVCDNPSLRGLASHFYVDNTMRTLQALANAYRKLLRARIVGITGSNGKTTTKELVNAVLSQKFKTHSTVGNLNNHIGVPLTLLTTPMDTEYLIVEMGANYPDEIAELAKIVEPDIGIITSLGKAHLGGFGSQEVIYRTKAGLFVDISTRSGTMFIHEADHEKIRSYLFPQGQMHILYPDFFIINDSKYEWVLKRAIPHIEFEVRGNGKSISGASALPGEYNFFNIRIAASLAIYLGLDLPEVVRGIESYIPLNNRSQWLKWGDHQVLLDAYNANPTSMESAITSFAKLPHSAKVLVLGGMKELGDATLEEHRNVLKTVSRYCWSLVLLVGCEFQSLAAEFPQYNFTTDKSDVLKYLGNLKSSAYILIKGSRSYSLETIIQRSL